MVGESEYEKLGLFYLGRESREDTLGATVDEPVLYDSRHLVTHGLCVGMTGSGKTGLGIGLLEEAAIDGIPALIIDPKGDMGNLLLSFPNLDPADFEPWVEEAEAKRKDLSVPELAAVEATKWRRGLESWGQGGSRIERFRDSVEMTIYTPGSTSGVPLAVLSSLAAPGETTRRDRELMADRVTMAVTSLLGLADLDTDSRSREFILLSTLLTTAWDQGETLDIPTLILQVQTPPVSRIGVLELESFYPGKDRFELAMALNSLLASPGFSSWLEGEPLDIDRMLYTEEGKPRLAICSIAHLDDRERMFFVSTLLAHVVSWMREQSGTSSLRALIYMDEIFGYLPPVAEPPSKRPMMTLLKQARAFGVGLVLATQNPADVDYKALSNIGTWFLGRLQTERDKQRLLDGLEGASGAEGLSRAEIDELLSGLPGRTFLLHDVKESEPVIFQTRWVLSYLKGPLTRKEISILSAKDSRRTATVVMPEPSVVMPAPLPRVEKAPTATDARHISAPVLAAGITSCYYLEQEADAVKGFDPELLGRVSVRFVDRKSGSRLREDLVFRSDIPREGDLADWFAANEGFDLDRIQSKPPKEAPHRDLEPMATKSRSYTGWKRDLADHVYHEHRINLLKSLALDETAYPGESEREFRIRLGNLARERRDQERSVLQTRYERELQRLEAREAKAQDKVAVQKEQLSGQKMKTAISFGTTLLTALMGRKRLSQSTLSRAGRAMSGVGRSQREAGDVQRAETELAVIQEDLRELETKLGEELLEISERYRPDREEFESVELAPLKKNVRVQDVDLLWVGR